MTGTLAPPFTKENAGEMARRATISREANRIGAKLSREQAQTRPPIEVEVHRVAGAMSKLPVTSKEYSRLAGLLDTLWDKAFSKQGAVKARGSRRESIRLEPVETPQGETPEIKHSKENPSAEAPTSQVA